MIVKLFLVIVGITEILNIMLAVFCLFRYKIDPKMLKKGKDVQLVCKAVDASFNVQPEKPSLVWNCNK